MLESLVNKDSIVRREILEMVLKTNDTVFMKKIEFILKILVKIKSVDSFVSGIILLNKNNYFGTYSLGYSRDLLGAILEKDSERFLKIFMINIFILIMVTIIQVNPQSRIVQLILERRISHLL